MRLPGHRGKTAGKVLGTVFAADDNGNAQHNGLIVAGDKVFVNWMIQNKLVLGGTQRIARSRVI